MGDGGFNMCQGGDPCGVFGVWEESMASLGSFPLTVTVTTMGYRSYKNPLNKAPLRTVTGRGNDTRHHMITLPIN